MAVSYPKKFKNNIIGWRNPKMSHRIVTCTYPDVIELPDNLALPDDFNEAIDYLDKVYITQCLLCMKNAGFYLYSYNDLFIIDREEITETTSEDA